MPCYMYRLSTEWLDCKLKSTRDITTALVSLAKSIRGELLCYTVGGLLYHCSVVPSAIHTASRKEGTLKITLCCQRLHRILHGSKLDSSKYVKQVLKNNMKGNRIRVQLERLTPHFEIITTSLVRFIGPLFQCSVRTPRSLTFLRENLRKPFML